MRRRIFCRLTQTAYNPTMSRPPRIPNWLPWDQSTVYFITFCVVNRKHVLANCRAWRICRATFDRLDQWITLAAIAMPDHLHLLISPLEGRDQSISEFSKWFKRWFNEAYWKHGSDGHSKSRLTQTAYNQKAKIEEQTWQWQEGCFDRLLRSDESLSEKWEYLRQNSVRAGLTKNPDDWPYQFVFNEANAGRHRPL